MNNIILIGMPGCGKSTVGVVLAKILGYNFIDSDLLIQSQEGKLLSDIIAEKGREFFNNIENKINASICAHNTVIATGGSVIYGKEAMDHLKSIGKIVYIKLSPDEIAHRIGDMTGRGISMGKNQTLYELYCERAPLYEQYADITVDAEGYGIRELALYIRSLLFSRVTG